MKNKLLILTFSIVAIFALWVLLEMHPKQPRRVECLGGDELSAPVFILPDLNGEKVDLRSFKGKIIVIEFWATWCGPCREAIPYLNELHRKYQKDGMVVIGISLDQGDPAKVRNFLKKLGVEYLNLMGDDTVWEAYNNIEGLGLIRGIPTTFMVDRKGRICYRFVGLTSKRVLEEAVQSLL